VSLYNAIERVPERVIQFLSGDRFLVERTTFRRTSNDRSAAYIQAVSRPQPQPRAATRAPSFQKSIRSTHRRLTRAGSFFDSQTANA